MSRRKNSWLLIVMRQFSLRTLCACSQTHSSLHLSCAPLPLFLSLPSSLPRSSSFGERTRNEKRDSEATCLGSHVAEELYGSVRMLGARARGAGVHSSVSD